MKRRISHPQTLTTAQGEIHFRSKFEAQVALDLTKKNVNGEIVYRNPGQVVSFNNLYINLYFSSGVVGLLWFLIFISNVLKKLYKRGNEYTFYIFSNLIVILLMFFFQAEELSTMLAISLGLMLLEFKNEKV